MTGACDAVGTAARIAAGTLSAEQVVSDALARIAARDEELNCFTTILSEHAMAQARAVDTACSQRRPPGRLAGVPFGVKDLFDIAGRPTRAGSKLLQNARPATRDAALIRRLKQEGAILLGTLNMDEFAYGFSTENAHYGTTRNPHDLNCIAGGSSGGSAAAVASGLAPFTLGSDTNGSIRVPAALCGVYGMKPSFGRLSRSGMSPFSASLDHAGHFAGSAADLALVYGCLLGHDPEDPVCVAHPAAADDIDQATLRTLRVGNLDGWFRDGATAAALAATDSVAGWFADARMATLPEAERARSAAFCITAAEAGQLHLPDLRTRAEDFDPATRDRLMAGALLPAAMLLHAQRFRAWFRQRVAELFGHFDILLAPSTPCTAPLIGQDSMRVGDRDIPVRANLGMYTQPLSFIGLPVISVPIHRLGEMPLGVQLIGRPWSEDVLLAVALALERDDVIGARPAGATAA